MNRADPDDAGRRIRQTTRLRSDRRGAIAILAAMSLLMLVTASAMALDVANLYLAQSTNQWIADQSALAAAFAYSQSGNSLTTAQNAASSMAVVNGAGSATVNATIGASPSGDGHNALKVVVTLPVTLSPFGRTIAQAGATSITVSATAYAELHTTTPCIVALAKSSAGGTGISATSSNVTATGCEMASNYTVTSTSGAHVTAASIYAVGSISASSGGTLTGSQFPSSSAQSDPFASSSVFSRMASVAALTAPSFPAVGSAPSGGSTMTCSGTLTVPSGSHSTITIGSGCTTVNFTGGAETDISGSGLSVSNSTATLNFAAGTYKINGITVGNSSTGTVTINATGTVVFDIWSGITLSGAAVLKVNGPATYNVQGYGITNNSSGAMTFNNSRGASTSTFFVAGGISLPYGPGTFPNGSYTIENSAGNGLSVGSNMTVTFGNGSYVISGQTGGINVGSSGHLTIGSQIDSSSVFQITGIQYSYDDAIYTNGNSSLTIGSFTNLDINGAVALNSTVSFGAGIYTINGAFSACTSGGSLSGTNVSFIASGAICFGAGFSSVNLTAPTAIDGSTVGSAATIALASNSSTASAVTSGAVSTVVEGAVYLPHATLTISGGGNLNGGGNCLQVVASSLTFSNDGNGVSTSCASLGGSAASATITLVQ